MKSRIIICLSSLIFFSCSNFSTNDQYVKRTEYEKLKASYDNLKNKMEKKVEPKVDDVQVVIPPSVVLKDKKPDAATRKSIGHLAETVDVFKEVTHSTDGLGTKIDKTVNDNSNFNNELIELNKARLYLAKKEYPFATEILNRLEQSRSLPLRTQAKFEMSKMLFDRKEYDLAMQGFEFFISEYAQSGLVIDSLGKLIVCAEKMKLREKKDKYFSVLHDFFEDSE